MYKSLLFILLLLLNITAFATVYYSQQSGSPNTLGNWNSQRSGGGNSPANFTTNGDEFIIQNNHILISTGPWVIAGNTSRLVIEDGGILQANHPVTFNGFFVISDGGRYAHNHDTDSGDNGFGDNERGIFNGTNMFSPNSTVEIRNWSDNETWLPIGFEWGNIIINYTADLGGEWNQGGTMEIIKGDLVIESTGTASNYFALTAERSMQLDIDGDFEINGGKIVIKTGELESNQSIIQVMGNVLVSGGELNLGNNDFLPNNELLVAGDFTLSETGAVTSLSPYSMVVFNGSSSQQFQAASEFNASIKVLPGAEVNLTSNFQMAETLYFVISGIFNAGSFELDLSNVELFVAGGTLNSEGFIIRKSGRTSVCTGTGNFTGPSLFCGSTGSQGVMNLNGAFMFMDQSVLSTFNVGQMNSSGVLNLTNSAAVSFTDADGAGGGSFELFEGSTLSLDEFSVIEGRATYYGRGGHLIIGSAEGITSSLESGNITVSINRFYDEENLNTFEYRSSTSQETGSGLPDSIKGNLIINNTSIDGVTLTKGTKLLPSSSLSFINGRLITVGNILITVDAGASITGGKNTSFIDGPLRKIGNTTFIFPIGKTGIYSPVRLAEVSGGMTTDSFRVEYFPGSPQAQFGNNLRDPLHHISNVEYWTINQEAGNSTKDIRLSFNERSAVDNFTSLTLANYIEGQWQEVVKTGTTGTSSAGTISFTTGFYGSFTLASTNTQNPLPVTIISFTAIKENNHGKLNWEISVDDTPASFDILHSSDNRNFNSIGSVSGNSGQVRYGFIHESLASGPNYYRLRSIDQDGSIRLSKVLVVYHNASSGIYVSINPSVAHASTNISLSSAVAGKYKLAVTNHTGQIVYSRDIQLSAGTSIVPLETSSYSSGVYNLTVLSDGKRIATVRFIKTR